MDAHRESIWQRDSAREIMREARKRFREGVKKDPIGAHVALASVHYSLIKRYKEKAPFAALWHAWRSAHHANLAFEESGNMPNHVPKFTSDQADVVSTIWSKVPVWLGGFPAGAISILTSELYLDNQERKMKPHTRALMLITLGELEWRWGKVANGESRFEEATLLVPVIETEDSEDRALQLIRVLRKIGFFYFGSSSIQKQLQGEQMLTRAADLARAHSRDQHEEIMAEWAKRRRSRKGKKR